MHFKCFVREIFLFVNFNKGFAHFSSLVFFKRKTKGKETRKIINNFFKLTLALPLLLVMGEIFQLNLLSNFKTKKNIKFRKFHRQADEWE